MPNKPVLITRGVIWVDVIVLVGMLVVNFSIGQSTSKQIQAESASRLAEKEEVRQQLADLQDRIRRLHSLEERLEVIDELVAQADTGYVIVDGDSKVLSWNQGAETIFGWTAKEMLGQSIHRLMWEENIPKHNESYRQAFAVDGPNAAKPVKNLICQSKTKTGAKKEIVIRTRVLRKSNGQKVAAATIDETKKVEFIGQPTEKAD